MFYIFNKFLWIYLNMKYQTELMITIGGLLTILILFLIICGIDIQDNHLKNHSLLDFYENRIDKKRAIYIKHNPVPDYVHKDRPYIYEKENK